MTVTLTPVAVASAVPLTRPTFSVELTRTPPTLTSVTLVTLKIEPLPRMTWRSGAKPSVTQLLPAPARVSEVGVVLTLARRSSGRSA